MKSFSLIRFEDVKTVSGIGRVAVGIDFGQYVALTWIVDAKIEHVDGTHSIERIRTLTIFESVDHVQKLHGHGSRTRVEFDQVLDLETFKLIQNKLTEFLQKTAKVAA